MLSIVLSKKWRQYNLIIAALLLLVWLGRSFKLHIPDDIKENDLEHAGIDIPERPISLETNYVTPNGLQQLKNKLDTLDLKRQSFTKNEVVKQLESDLSIKSVRQYIEGTFGPDTATTLSNDFFRNKTKIRKTVGFCLYYDIAITKYYQSLYDDLD